MNILGAIFSFVVVLLIGGPLALLIISTTPNSPWLIFLAALAQHLLAGFLVVYTFAVLSGFLFALLGEVATRAAPTFQIRRVAIWILSLLYVGGTAFYLTHFAPALLKFHLAVFTATATAVFSTTASLSIADALAFTWLLFMFFMPMHFIAVLIGYIAASELAPRHDQYVYSNSEMFVRGLLIGLNAGMNLLLGTTAIGGILTAYLGPVGVFIGCAAGIILVVVNLLTAGMPTDNQDANKAIKCIVGWMSWLMPTNWIITFLGWILYLINALFSVLLGWTPFYGLYLINAVLIEWPYGTLFIEGGIGSNLWPQGPIHARGGYNLGLFGFIHADTIPIVEPLTRLRFLVGLGTTDFIFKNDLREHESGHNLNLTALGSYFHLIGAVDENVPWGRVPRLANAYAERLADSNVPGPTGGSAPYNAATNPHPQTPLPFWTY